MLEIKIYSVEMQQDVERFFTECFSDLGWNYEPDGEHSDIKNIQDVYMSNGCMWCMYHNNQLIGTVAIKTLNNESRITEIKRLYVLKRFQGSGYGNLLFETALNYAKENKFNKIYTDTAKDSEASQNILRKHGFNRIPKCGGSQYTELFFEFKIS